MIKDSDNMPAKTHQILFGLFISAVVEGLMEVTFSLVHFMDSKAMDRFSPFTAKSIANGHVSRSGEARLSEQVNWEVEEEKP